MNDIPKLFIDKGCSVCRTFGDKVLNHSDGIYVNSIEDWFNNETFYSNPRRIELGMKYDF